MTGTSVEARIIGDRRGQDGLPMPKFEEIIGGFRVTAYNKTAVTKETPQVTEQVTGSILKLIAFCGEAKSRKERRRPVFELGFIENETIKFHTNSSIAVIRHSGSLLAGIH